MSDKTKREQGQDDKPTVDTSILNKTEELDTQKQGVSEVEKKLSHRSNESVEQGGQNEKQGEPNPGYGSVAPGHQGGGQR